MKERDVQPWQIPTLEIMWNSPKRSFPWIKQTLAKRKTKSADSWMSAAVLMETKMTKCRASITTTMAATILPGTRQERTQTFRSRCCCCITSLNGIFQLRFDWRSKKKKEKLNLKFKKKKKIDRNTGYCHLECVCVCVCLCFMVKKLNNETHVLWERHCFQTACWAPPEEEKLELKRY